MIRPKLKALGVAVIFDFTLEHNGRTLTVQYDATTGCYDCNDSEDAWRTVDKFEDECDALVAKEAGSILDMMVRLNAKYKKNRHDRI